MFEFLFHLLAILAAVAVLVSAVVFVIAVVVLVIDELRSDDGPDFDTRHLMVVTDQVLGATLRFGAVAVAEARADLIEFVAAHQAGREA